MHIEFSKNKKNFLFSQSKLTGFTLIELLVTASIILLMAVIAIPAYDRYAAKADFLAKTDELKEMIDQTKIFSKNPEQNIDRYEVDVDETSNAATLKKIKLTDNAVPPLAFTKIKTIKMPSGTTITGTSGSVHANARYYVCDSPSNNCCLFTFHENWKCDKTLHPAGSTDGGISTQMNDGDWLTITNEDLNLSRKISLKAGMAVIENQ